MVRPEQSNESGEDRLIARYFRPLARDPGAFGLMDDAAVFTPPAGSDVVLKTDAIVGGVHFFADDPPGDVARKALRVNLSDLAAKGAAPAGFLLALAMPDSVTDAWLSAFAQGLGADAESYGCPLFGGDTDKTPGPVTISIAAFGLLPHGTMVRRNGAKPGDCLFVSGTIGDAALGVKLRRDAGLAGHWGLSRVGEDHLLARYRVPQPRMALAAVLRAHASAAMDVSDGLAGDLTKLARVSGVSADVEVARVPLSPAARTALAADPALIETILAGGDDYEIIAAVPADKARAFQRAAAEVAVAVTEIGHVVAGDGAPRFLDRNGRPLALQRLSYSHF